MPELCPYKDKLSNTTIKIMKAIIKLQQKRNYSND